MRIFSLLSCLPLIEAACVALALAFLLWNRCESYKPWSSLFAFIVSLRCCCRCRFLTRTAQPTVFLRLIHRAWRIRIAIRTNTNNRCDLRRTAIYSRSYLEMLHTHTHTTRATATSSRVFVIKVRLIIFYDYIGCMYVQMGEFIVEQANSSDR